jgi:hypothetical protein
MSGWSHRITVKASNPDTRTAIVQAEIVVKSLDGYVPVSVVENGNTAEIVFRSAK